MPSDKIVNSVKQLILSVFNKTGYSLIKLPPEKDRQKPLAAAPDSDTSDIKKPVQDIFRPDWDCLSADELLLLCEQKKNDPAALYDLSRFFLGMGKEKEAMHLCGQSLSLNIMPAAQQQQLSSLQKCGSNRSITLSGKRMVVTGGASGIGKAIVDRLVLMGAHVMAIDKNDDALDTLAVSIPQVTPISLDLSDLDRIADTATKIGDVDVVILNAAIYEEADFLDLDTADVLRLMRNNFLGHVTLAQHLVKKMNGGGSIVIIGTGSEHAPINTSRCPHYMASKAALSSFFMASCNDLKTRHVMVNEVLCNDAFDTPMILQVSALSPEHLLADPKMVAEAVIPFAIADPEQSFITGCSVTVQMRR